MNLGELKSSFQGDITIDKLTLDEYSHDASIFSVRPEVVMFPKNSDDISSLVQFVRAQKKSVPNLSITARAAGTDMTGGPLSESIVIGSTKYLNHFAIENEHAKIQPGVYYRDFEKEADQRGVMFPSYPASKSICAFGGIVNNNSGGEKTLRYGKTADYVEEISVVLDDGSQVTLAPLSSAELESKKKQKSREGEVYRKMHALIEENYDLIQEARPKVSKNSAGYALWDVWNRESGIFNLAKLFVGAQGTLGIMTEAKLKLVKKPKHTKLAVFFFKELGQMPEAVNAVRHFSPDSLEIFDDKTMWLALRFFSEIAKKAGQWLLPFAIKFVPEAWIGVKMLGMPKLVMLIECSGDDEAKLDKKLEDIRVLAKQFGAYCRLAKTSKAMDKYWTIRRESFSLLRKHVGKDKRATPFVDDFVVDPKYLPEVLPKVYEILEQHGIEATLAGHAGSGNVHIIPLMNLSDEREREKIFTVAEKVYDLVLAHKGSITAEHNDGLIRTMYLKKMFGKEVYRLLEKTKEIFDPLNIFNPGKKTDASKEFVEAHISRGK